MVGEDRVVRVAGDHRRALVGRRGQRLAPAPAEHRDVVLGAQVVVAGRRRRQPAQAVLDLAPDPAQGEAREPRAAVAEVRSLVAVDQEEHAERRVAVEDPELERLEHLDAGQQRVEVGLDLAGVTPVDVVVAEEARQAGAVQERLLELRAGGVAGQHLADVVLPQLLDVAQEEELVAALEVPAERSAVGRLAALEVVGAVAGAAVQVGEDRRGAAARAARRACRRPRRPGPGRRRPSRRTRPDRAWQRA